MGNKEHLRHIETIRAIAALMVLSFHFVNYNNGSQFFIESKSIRTSFTFGAQGVELFYLISGFIIPYSLLKGGYKIKHFFLYISKRIIRLYPPYLLTIVGILVANLIFNEFIWETKAHIGIKQILANVFFLTDLFPNIEWINPIFRTLKVEFQFYLLIGILFPFLIQNRFNLILGCFALLGTGILLIGSNNVFTNAPFFVTGLILFLIFQNQWKWEYIIILLISQLILLQFYYWEDLIINLIGIILIIGLPKESRFLQLTGKISYPIYLIHGLFGGWFLYAASKFESGNNYPFIAIILAALISWGAAWIMHFLIEKPSMRWSRKIQYKN